MNPTNPKTELRDSLRNRLEHESRPLNNRTNLCGRQTRSAIRSLTLLYFAEKKTGQISDPADDAVREGLRWVPRNCHTTDILGVWMPLVVTVGWAMGVLIAAL